jgi:DNA-binding FrmR family transcriptional regulator
MDSRPGKAISRPNRKTPRRQAAGGKTPGGPAEGAQQQLKLHQVHPIVEYCMSLTVRESSKLLSHARRIRGQIEAVERALEHEIGCSDVLQLIAGAHGALNGLMAEVLEDHIRTNVVDPAREPDRERASATEDLLDVVRSYLK